MNNLKIELFNPGGCMNPFVGGPINPWPGPPLWTPGKFSTFQGSRRWKSSNKHLCNQQVCEAQRESEHRAGCIRGRGSRSRIIDNCCSALTVGNLLHRWLHRGTP